MAINFPDNPSDGDIASIGGVTYTYTASANSWKPPAPGASASTLTDLNISDGTSGQLLTTDGNNNFSFTSVSSASSTEIFADMAALIAKTGMNAGDQGLVLDNNKLFMYTGSAWYLIATMVNNSPTAITNVDSSYNLSNDGTPTVITATSTDPEGFPLTWSYAITSGSLGSTATISQTDNVFTITPSTNSADSGEFTLTISATDGGSSGIVNKVTPISLAFVVANSRYTTLLVTATEDSDNNNVTDSSTNNHSITLNGNPYAGTFSPYRSGGYSPQFDGSNFISASASSDFAFGTGDFTVEFWFYMTSNDWRLLIDQTYANLGISIWINPDRSILFYPSTTIGGKCITSTVNYNEWNHVALVRSSGTTRVYANGISGTTYSDSNDYTSTAGLRVSSDYASSQYAFSGYQSDIRVSKGLARYTANFTPPTEAFESDANTTLLISSNSLPYFSDGSTNDHSITANGNFSFSPTSPYDYTEYYSTDHGGSVYFPGGGSASFTPSDASFGFGTGDYTIEGWFNFDDNGAFTGGDGATILSTLNSLSGVGAHLWVSANTIRFYNASADRIISSAVSVKEWHHIALVRSSGNTKLYIDGNQTGATYADSNDYGATAPFSIGSYHNNGAVGSVTKNMIGYVSDLKVTKGQAIYTSSFTPPTAPLSSSGASLHIKGIDASIIDKSQTSNLNLIGNTTGSNTQTKYAPYSIYFDGSAGGINDPDSESYGFGTGDFTIDFWLYYTGGSGYAFFLNNNAGAGNYVGYGLNTGTITPWIWNGGNVLVGSSNITANTWQHHAIVRNAGALTIYLDGYSIGSTTWTVDLGQSRPFYIGHNSAFTQTTSGYIEDLRVTKGLARYTTNFTPPTSSLKG
jgi:hypothetical protein